MKKYIDYFNEFGLGIFITLFVAELICGVIGGIFLCQPMVELSGWFLLFTWFSALVCRVLVGIMNLIYESGFKAFIQLSLIMILLIVFLVGPFILGIVYDSSSWFRVGFFNVLLSIVMFLRIEFENMKY
jgi:hypothetical protein